VDVYAGLWGPGATPPLDREQATCLSAYSNIVMDRVRVACPDGTVVILPRYTDVFSPDVDWTTAFRFLLWQPGLPVAGGRYAFTALDVVGDPIPGVAANDVWVGTEPPEPPADLSASVVAGGTLVDWDEVPDVVGSFEPASAIGFYQLELWDSYGTTVYGANWLAAPPYLIPQDSLDAGDYGLGISVVSFAPEDSAGHGIEYHNFDPTAQIWISLP